MDYKEVENILSIYTLESILEYNDLTEVDVLYFLVQQNFIEVPNPRPLDFE